MHLALRDDFKISQTFSLHEMLYFIPTSIEILKKPSLGFKKKNPLLGPVILTKISYSIKIVKMIQYCNFLKNFEIEIICLI